jgi:hypothetical protein
MKNNELIVGNWVIAPTEYVYKQKQVRVWQIRDTIIIDYDQDWNCIERLAPIPITEDFLKKNGFTHKCIIDPDEYYPEGLCEWEKEVQGNWLTLSVGSNKIGCDWRLHVDNCDRDSIGHVAVQYVHQLQNFLNILGIEMEVIV